MPIMNDFGPELVNILDRVEDFDEAINPESTAGAGANIGGFYDSALLPLFRDRRPLILFFPPGRYRLPLRATPYDFPEHVELFFSPGALLRADANVDVIIRGSIRAGKQQIFGYDRLLPLPAGVSGVNTVPLGRILLWSDLIPEVYPEWWGAYGPLSNPTDHIFRRGLDSSDAIQAAIDAACVLRDDPRAGVRRPALPVVLSDRYQCNQTLVVNCESGTDDLCLVLRGSGGLSLGSGTPSITRVRERVDPANPDDAELGDCVLRLGPGVDFDIQDVSFATVTAPSTVDGCIDVVGDLGLPHPRRGLLRRCSLISGRRYGLSVYEPPGAMPHHVVLDSCAISPMNESYLTRAALQLSGGAHLMLHLDGGLMGAGILDSGIPLPVESATIVQAGASLLVRATMFHAGNGPRPSRTHRGSGEVDLTIPDGQEIFLHRSPGDTQALAAQVTTVQTESQGWWFLSRPFGGGEQVVLLATSQNNVNWVASATRYLADGGDPIAVDDHIVNKPAPPSVVWLGPGGQCVLIACRFHDSVLTDGEAVAGLTNVATFFLRGLVNLLSVPQFFRRYGAPGALSGPPRYPQEFNPVTMGDAFDGVMPRVRVLRNAPRPP